jgi:3D (Asp-Asp-Asp) domain-containing protein
MMVTLLTPILNPSKDTQRVVVIAALLAFITTMLPMRVVAAEVVSAPNAVAAEATQDAAKETKVDFVLPSTLVKNQAPVARSEAQVTDTSFVPDTVREQATGYKVVRVYKHVPTTAYTSRPEETDDSPFITADGSHVRDGIVAANFLKFGTKIRIPELYGDKIFEVHDRMNKRYNVKVDIWMDNLQAARKHGSRHVTIEIVSEADAS